MRERAFDSRSRSTARPRPSPSAVPSSVRSFTISSERAMATRLSWSRVSGLRVSA